MTIPEITMLVTILGWVVTALFQLQLAKRQGEIQRTVSEHNIVFEELHKKRASVVPEMYARLAKMHRSFGVMLDPITTGLKGPYLTEAINDSLDKGNQFSYYFDENKLFLSDQLRTEIAQVIQEYRQISIRYQIAIRNDPDNEQKQLVPAWEESMNKLSLKIAPIEAHIETCFHDMLSGQA